MSNEAFSFQDIPTIAYYRSAGKMAHYFHFRDTIYSFSVSMSAKIKKKCYTADIETESETSRSVEQHLKQCWMSHYNKISLPRVKRKRVQRASCVYLTTEWLSLISRG